MSFIIYKQVMCSSCKFTS